MSTEFFNDQWRIPSNENQNKVSNYCMEFDGSSDSINVGQSLNIYSSQSRTISCWFNINSFATTPAGDGSNLLGYGTGSTLQAFSLAVTKYVNNPNHRLYLHVWDNTYDISGTTQILENNWYLATVTYDGSTLKLYLNGNLEGSSSTSSLNTTTSDFIIGQGLQQHWNTLNGKIDQVTVFDYALSPIQVASLGLDGYAFNFIPNGYINAGTGLGNSLGTYTGDASVSLWFKADTTISNDGLFSMTPFDGNTFGNLRINISSNILYFVSSELTSWKTIPFTDTTSWHHLVCIFKSGDITNSKIYLDGIDQTTTDVGTFPSSLSMTGKKTIIGGYYGTNNTFDGELSNVSFFNTGLSQSQVNTLYNSGKPLTNMSSFTSLQGWWKLDDTATFNSGTSVWTIPDDSTNSNNGASVGMTSSSLVASNINGELITNPMITSPKPIAYYQLGDQSVSTGPTSNYLVPNNSLSDYDFKFVKNNSLYTSGDSIDIRGINNILDGATSMSMTFWVYLDPAVYNNGMFFRLENANGAGAIQLRFIRYGNARGPVWQFTMSDGVNSTPSGNTSTPSRPHYYNSDFLPSPAGSNMWWNLTCTWDGSTAKIYRNGITQHPSRGEGAYIGTIANTGTAFLGGNAAGATSSGLFMNGRLSNIAFWRNYTLTQAETTEVYNNGAPLDLNSFSGAAPAAWYKLNAGEIFNNTSTEWSVDNNAYPSVYQNSLDFNGTSDYIDCGDSNTFSFGNGTTDSPFSISAWIKMDDATRFRIASKFNSSSNNEYIFTTSASDELAMNLYDESLGAYIGRKYTTTLTSYQGQWIHVVATYDGTSSSSGIKLYLNGTKVDNIDNNSGSYEAMENTIQPLFIGQQAGTYANGQISNTAIFNTELSSTQVTTLYNNGTPEASISHSPVSWWKLDNTTTGLIDNGSASNNGTNNGATKYAGFVNALAGESSGMNSANLVTSDLQQTSGYSPYALDFDGIDDYLTITSTDFKGGSGTVSYSFWIKPNTYSGSSNYGYFLTDSSTGGGIAYSEGGTSIGTTPGQMYLYNMTNAGAVSTIISTFIDENVWNHIVVVFNTGNIVQFYKNGALSSTLTGITSFDATWDTIAARRYSGGVNNFVNGELSNFSIFDTALTSTEVNEIYNQGRPSDLNTFSGTAPVAWWQIGSNSSFNSSTWTCLDEIGTNNAVSSANMTNSDIVDGVGYSASGVGTSSIDIKGDAPYSTANGLSENMDVLDRTTDVPS